MTPQLDVLDVVDGIGVVVRFDGLRAEQARPIRLDLSSGGFPTLSLPYASASWEGAVLVGDGVVVPAPGVEVRVRDEWRSVGDEVTVRRTLAVRGSAPLGFASALTVARPGRFSWAGVEPFAPGLCYGDAEPVARWAIGGAPARREGVRAVIAREDRMAAPVFALWYPDRRWLAVVHDQPDGATVAADGLDVDGDVLVDPRLRFASLGADNGALGGWVPGTEGDCTYSSGPLPLRQLRAWRRRFHPLEDGLTQELRLRFRAGQAEERWHFFRDVWRWSWTALSPAVTPMASAAFLDPCANVLASQVRTGPAGAGVGLESDPVSGKPLPTATAAVMGFVGANTDAGYVLLRAADALADEALRRAGAHILDSFARLGLDPPAGEGFDLATGAPSTYRTFAGVPAVYVRSLAEGCHAALRAWWHERDQGHDHDDWRQWALSGARWLVAQQRPGGSFPRAWEAGTGRVIDGSSTASHVAVPFLVAAARASGDERLLAAAIQAAEHSWDAYGSRASFAGGTLNNPNVVDKEASVLALEAFLALLDATGDAAWLDRAVVAGTIAETWIHLWDIPMPVDAPPDIHWKPGRPTTGLQLITSGASMSDGFLATNAAVFVELAARTGDQHFAEVAWLVHHGTKSMLATGGESFDVAGPGWQQEHWGFATCRGYGLNRSWLPWTAVAVLDGYFRLRDLPRHCGGEIAQAVLAGQKPWASR